MDTPRGLPDATKNAATAAALITADAAASAITLAAVRAATGQAQAHAADPTVSAWVSANAGTGKTYVLTMRVLRLLLAGTAPERILCLTYTKAAAAEMSTRVFDRLADWVTAAPDRLMAALTGLLGRPATTDEVARARQLFARAIETPGGLKVQTIHAFCERLLQRFPLEAGVPPHFSILDDETGAALLREATDRVLTASTRPRRSAADGGHGHDEALATALAATIAYANEDGFEGLLRQALANRDWLAALSTLDAGADDPWPQVDAFYRGALGIGADVTRASLDAAVARLVPHVTLGRLKAHLATGSKTDLDGAGRAGAAIAATTANARFEAYAALFLTKDGKARASLMTTALKEAAPDLDATATQAQERFVDLAQQRSGLVALDATLAILRLAREVMQDYTAAKARRAALDFDDLIARTANLLAISDQAEWVLYKLDGGLDHILVDEAQDTSPTQWRIIEALAREFFSGAGARTESQEMTRTLFAVGDEKQSIYSFQGARPGLFAETGVRVARQIEQAGLAWRRIPLTLSFRTVAPLLDAVDQVFADASRMPGLTSEASAIRHIADRFGQAGLIEIWEPEKPAVAVAGDAWLPHEEQTEASPPTRLAARIAETIHDWLTTGEKLASADRPIRAGDVIVLLRRRQPLGPAIVAALKVRGIAVAGADRIELTRQIAVLDLLALGDFLLLPEDDLALATVLKSPLIGLDDDDLLAIAPERRGSLWSALLAAADAGAPRFAAAAVTLKRWRARADLTPPFEFFATLLDRDGGRQRLLARLGSEAADAIDELLDLAIAYDEIFPPSLQGFIGWLRQSEKEIKRDMEQGRDEVRVLTVHGAKGLEAPIVFLPDTCAARSGRQGTSLLTMPDVPRKSGIAADPLVWPVKGTSKLPAIASASRAVADAEANERNRLLYVALTRARDRLYIGGAQGTKGRAKGCWYDQITEALAGRLTADVDAAGRTVRRIASPQSAPPEAGKAHAATVVNAQPLPAWASRPAPVEPQLIVPLTPSRLAPLETDDAGEPVAAPPPKRPAEPPASPPAARGAGDRFLRGTLTHALLEHLPTLPPASWDKAAAGFVARKAIGLDRRVQASIVAETLAILRHGELGALFGPDSRPEVPIVAEIAPPAGKGQTLRLTGQIDRLVVTGEEVLIVDYKTNRPPPHDAHRVADAYVLQLAAYRLGLARIFPGKLIRAAIVWTDGARILEIPARLLDAQEARIWSGELIADPAVESA